MRLSLQRQLEVRAGGVRLGGEVRRRAAVTKPRGVYVVRLPDGREDSSVTPAGIAVIARRWAERAARESGLTTIVELDWSGAGGGE